MEVERVDPRDTEWVDDRPVYRVYFWHRPPAPPGVAPEHAMWHCDEYRLSNVADVIEVVDWARDRARSQQTFVIYVEQRDANRSGLVRLLGADPASAT
ncbi:hypothetical protein L2K70_19470 [Nocardioides KLBMP 9356]|uniref:Uncharacterized protein n=1 Tax=Nocardioides potassii TaxID=2911371 RepID=A0ABS9HHM4_9ACTN|nr:hypothetical protein [Nocardioides potassii]MCF6379798.1 hypothetical protein [Nocardioides potassii]